MCKAYLNSQVSEAYLSIIIIYQDLYLTFPTKNNKIFINL